MTTNILLRLEKPHHIECLKTFMISSVDDLTSQKFHFLLFTPQELHIYAEEVMIKIKETLQVESLTYKVIESIEDLPEHKEVSVRSIVLPGGLTSGITVNMTPVLFKEKMNVIETSCKIEAEIWTFEEADDVGVVLRYCYSQVVQLLDFAERVMEDIKTRLVPSQQKSESEPGTNLPEPEVIQE